MRINIIKKLTLLQYLFYAGFICGIIGCSTVKKMPDELPDVKYSDPTQAGSPKQVQGKGSPGNDTGSGNGKGTQGNGTGSGKNDQAGSGAGKNKGAGTGTNKDAGKGVTNKGEGKGTGGTKKVEDEVAGFLNLDSPEPTDKKGKSQGKVLPQANEPQVIPLSASTGKAGEAITRTPSANAGQKLIADLKKSGVTDENFNKKPPRLVLDKPRRTSRKFDAAPPVIKKVNDSFMPYKAGQVITLDANLVPAKKSASRIICLYSGASVYLSFNKNEVKMGGLYVRGKFKVRGIVKEDFSGKDVPVAILDKL